MFGIRSFAEAEEKDARLTLVRNWMRERRVFVEPIPCSDQTRAEMRRGAERTGSPDPFASKITTVSIGTVTELKEPTDDFPTEHMVAQIALALDAREDER